MRTAAGNELHMVADLVLSCFFADGRGEIVAGPEERQAAIEEGRLALARYRSAAPAERTEAADELAVALEALLIWPSQPEAERPEVTEVIYRVAMAHDAYFRG